jgi:hypothetical protein
MLRPDDTACEYWQAAVEPALRSALVELARLSPKPENPLLFLGEALAQHARCRGAQPSVQPEDDGSGESSLEGSGDTASQRCYAEQHHASRGHAALEAAGIKPSSPETTVQSGSSRERLAVIVFGASGDLATKKTYAAIKHTAACSIQSERLALSRRYPALFALYAAGLLPESFVIYGCR